MVDISHPEIQGVLKRFTETGPIYDTDAFERELIHMAYQRMRWQALSMAVTPDMLATIEDFVDNKIRWEARRLREQKAAGDAE